MLPRNYRIHRHCFTGDWSEGQNWLQRFPSSFIGVTPLVTQRGGRAAAVREFVKHVPLDKLLLETDSPYFVPNEVSIGIGTLYSYISNVYLWGGPDGIEA